MAVGVKLGPGTDRDVIPAGAEAQWISVDGDVVELGVWFGQVARPGIGRAALVIRGDAAHELTAPAPTPRTRPMGPLGDYLYEPDGAVIRARLIGDLARANGAWMLSLAHRLPHRRHGDRLAVRPRVPRRSSGCPPTSDSCARPCRHAASARSRSRSAASTSIRRRCARALKLRGDERATLVLTRDRGPPRGAARRAPVSAVAPDRDSAGLSWAAPRTRSRSSRSTPPRTRGPASPVPMPTNESERPSASRRRPSTPKTIAAIESGSIHPTKSEATAPMVPTPRPPS